MENKSGIKSATKTAIYDLDEYGIVAFIGLTRGDIANLDATKENYWETKSNLQQNIIWAWERFSQLRTAEYLGFGKKGKIDYSRCVGCFEKSTRSMKVLLREQKK